MQLSDSELRTLISKAANNLAAGVTTWAIETLNKEDIMAALDRMREYAEALPTAPVPA